MKSKTLKEKIFIINTSKGKAFIVQNGRILFSTLEQRKIGTGKS